MDSLDKCYVRILTAGLIAIRDAAKVENISRCHFESEHIHNIPSLIREVNVNRHLYYLAYERTSYINWALSQNDHELMAFIENNYMQEWKRIEQEIEYDKLVSAGEWIRSK